MKYRGIFEYEYPTEHKPPVRIDVYLHGDCVKGKIIEWEYRPLDQEPTTKNDSVDDCISRADARKAITDHQYSTNFCEEHNIDHSINTGMALIVLSDLPPVTPQETRCKECKWWKDSDGEYRRGCGAESRCPINRREVFEGNGYCYLFEPQESGDKG